MQRKFPDESILTNEEKTHISETFHATIDIGVEKIRSSFNELIKTDDLQLVKSVLNFLEVFFNPALGFNQTDPKARKKDIDCILGFSYSWGMGAALDERSKDYFDTFIKDCFKGSQFPSAFTVFDYYYDLKKTKSWMPWENQVQKFEYVKDMSFFDMMVPTADTYKHRFCLE
jgi:dynein heavy chain